MKAVLAGVALLVLLANCSGASGSRGLLGIIHIFRNHFFFGRILGLIGLLSKLTDL